MTIKRSLIASIISVFLLLILVVPVPCQESDTLKLASWNIRIFSNGSRNDTELTQICQILKDYDFISIVELKDEEILKRAETMLQTMGRDYDYQVSDPIGNVVKEQYAFLYDRTMVEVVRAGEVFPDPDNIFIREPYYATFRAGEFDFTAIAIHVVWGYTVGERRAEIQALANVYTQIQDMDPEEQDILLMGDFNREPDDDESYAPLRAIPSMTALFSLPAKSHIRESSLYDNIWFQSDYVVEYADDKGIDKFDETVFSNDDDAANLAVSDHRPIWAVFHTDKDDDGVAGASGASGTQNTTWGEIRKLRQQVSELKEQINRLNNRVEALELAIAQTENTDSSNVTLPSYEGTQPESDVTVYATRTGSKYHNGGCRHLRSSRIPMKLSEAKRRYSACGTCNPPR